MKDDIEEEYDILIKKFDKIFNKYFGKMCPDFQSSCFQCRINIIYNKFKMDLYDKFVGSNHTLPLYDKNDQK